MPRLVCLTPKSTLLPPRLSPGSFLRNPMSARSHTSEPLIFRQRSFGIVKFSSHHLTEVAEDCYSYAYYLLSGNTENKRVLSREDRLHTTVSGDLSFLLAGGSKSAFAPPNTLLYVGTADFMGRAPSVFLGASCKAPTFPLSPCHCACRVWKTKKWSKSLVGVISPPSLFSNWTQTALSKPTYMSRKQRETE